MITSGQTAIATDGTDWVTVLQMPEGIVATGGYVINEGAVPGWFRINGDANNAGRLPPGAGVGNAGAGSVKISEQFTLLEVSRATGTDLSGIYGIAFQ